MDEPVADPPVVATPAALDAIARLVAERGPVMFFQSGGCCDGSLPMCFHDGEFIIGDHDVLLGEVGGCPFYMDGRQYEVWKHTQLILDVGEGAPEGFSLLRRATTSISSPDPACVRVSLPSPWVGGKKGKGEVHSSRSEDDVLAATGSELRGAPPAVPQDGLVGSGSMCCQMIRTRSAERTSRRAAPSAARTSAAQRAPGSLAR